MIAAMERYRRRPGVINALQLTDAEPWRVCRLFSDPWEIEIRRNRVVGTLLWVEKSRQWCEIDVGDYIIGEPDGKGVYPCKKALFEASYQPVPEEEPS